MTRPATRGIASQTGRGAHYMEINAMNDEFGVSRRELATSRRAFLVAAGSAAAAAALPSPFALAQESALYPLRGDDGKPLVNYKVPTELSPFDLPGVLWTGSPSADVVLFEFTDYNCPFCRKAAADMSALVAKDKNLRLGIVNNAILSPGSYQAARVQQSILRLYGPRRAYQFHERMFKVRGQKDGLAALALAKSMKFDVAEVEKSADSETVGLVVKRQVTLAANLSLVATPSYVLNTTAVLGYPGPKAVAAMVAATRKCDKPVCG